eukprot:1147139-Pelagomonas_calceolata.AAC.3
MLTATPARWRTCAGSCRSCCGWGRRVRQRAGAARPAWWTWWVGLLTCLPSRTLCGSAPKRAECVFAWQRFPSPAPALFAWQRLFAPAIAAHCLPEVGIPEGHSCCGQGLRVCRQV